MRRIDRRLFAAGLALFLAATLGAFAYSSAAQSYNQGAQLVALSTDGEAACAATGGNVPRVYQTKQFGIALRQFWDNEQVYLSIIFPDGRVFSPNAAGELDGVVDMPPNFPWVVWSSNGGDYFANFTASAQWPRGCYQMTAWGSWSNRLARGYFYLESLPMGQGNPGNTTLIVEDNTTGDPSGYHGTTVYISGRGFRAFEWVRIWLTAPDGTVIPYGADQLTSDVGSFATSFVFDSQFPPGAYAFTAFGVESGYQRIASFNLSAHNTTPNSYALLVVTWRQPAQAPQGSEFQIAGQFFQPYEPVAVWVTLPDNSVRTLPMQYTNEYGEFYADIFFDERLPVGTYRFTASGQHSNRVVISNGVAVLTPGDPVVNTAPPEFLQAPIVEDNNVIGTGGLGGAVEPAELIPIDPPALEPFSDLEPIIP